MDLGSLIADQLNWKYLHFPRVLLDSQSQYLDWFFLPRDLFNVYWILLLVWRYGDWRHLTREPGAIVATFLYIIGVCYSGLRAHYIHQHHIRRSGNYDGYYRAQDVGASRAGCLIELTVRWIQIVKLTAESSQ